MAWAAFLEPLRLSRSEDLAEEVKVLEPIRISELETIDVPGHTGYKVRRFLERPLSKGILRLDHALYEKGGGAEPHSTPHEEMMFMLKGNCVVRTANGQVHLSEEEFLRIPANVVHTTLNEEDEPAVILFFEFLGESSQLPG